REINQLTVCIQDVLPLVMKKKRGELSNTLRFWSAGCSIGCEPYTIALLLKETVSALEQWNIQIIGTDISNQALEYARQGIYSEQFMKDVPCLIKKKYFNEVSHK
ncbi:CheR family methyltransferase, partial [Arthrospira platensis SPKY1]|nr:CheR family methyltransferase [Arthrospira platensis SPKY1]